MGATTREARFHQQSMSVAKSPRQLKPVDEPAQTDELEAGSSNCWKSYVNSNRTTFGTRGVVLVITTL